MGGDPTDLLTVLWRHCIGDLGPADRAVWARATPRGLAGRAFRVEWPVGEPAPTDSLGRLESAVKDHLGEDIVLEVQDYDADGASVPSDDPGWIWARAAQLLRSQLSTPVWMTTFNELEPVGARDGELVLEAPSRLLKERVEERFLELIDDALVRTGSPLHAVVQSGGTRDVVERTGRSRLRTGHDKSGGSASSGPDLGPHPSLDLDNRLTFESFVVGDSNRFAHLAALAVAESPAERFNPLFVHGPTGVGKTHLLQAICHHIRNNLPRVRVHYVSTEFLLEAFHNAVRSETTDALVREYSALDVLLVDDVQFLEGRPETQLEFLRVFNALQVGGAQIVLSSDRPADSIEQLESGLRSRFKMGLCVDIQMPGYETRLAYLAQAAVRARVEVGRELLEFMAARIDDSPRVLEGAMVRLGAYCDVEGKPVSVETATKVLSGLFVMQERITAKAVIEGTAELFGLTPDDIVGRNRQRDVVSARQTAMYLCRELTDLSYPAIGRAFGDRDHMTVMHAVERIQSRLGAIEVQTSVSELRRRLQAQAA